MSDRPSEIRSRHVTLQLRVTVNPVIGVSPFDRGGSALYGIWPSPSTIPPTAGTPPRRDATRVRQELAHRRTDNAGWRDRTRPAQWACTSQLASLRACQMPLKFGLPSAVRAGRALPGGLVTVTHVMAPCGNRTATAMTTSER